MPINIFLDTSTLPQHVEGPPGSFAALAELSAAGLVSVHISELVRDEWTSQRCDDLRRLAAAVDGSLAKIKRHALASRLGCFAQIEALFTEFQAIGDEVSAVGTQTAHAMLQRLNPIYQPVAERAAREVFEWYFNGLPPFKKAKERSDIPDAFIFHSLSNLRIELRGRILVACADQRLAAACRSLRDVECYDSLESLISAEPIHGLIQQRNIAAHWDRWCERNFAQLPALEPLIVAAIDRAAATVLPGEEVNPQAGPYEAIRAEIAMAIGPREITIDWEEASGVPYGPGLISVPISFETEAILSYIAPRAYPHTEYDLSVIQRLRGPDQTSAIGVFVKGTCLISIPEASLLANTFDDAKVTLSEISSVFIQDDDDELGEYLYNDWLRM